MAKKSVATKPVSHVDPGLALKIGSAMALANVILHNVNTAVGKGFDTAFAESEIDGDDFICLVMQLRDRMIDVCKLSGVKS
jgi:hypothetical protein